MMKRAVPILPFAAAIMLLADSPIAEAAVTGSWTEPYSPGCVANNGAGAFVLSANGTTQVVLRSPIPKHGVIRSSYVHVVAKGGTNSTSKLSTLQAFAVGCYQVPNLGVRNSVTILFNWTVSYSAGLRGPCAMSGAAHTDLILTGGLQYASSGFATPKRPHHVEITVVSHSSGCGRWSSNVTSGHYTVVVNVGRHKVFHGQIFDFYTALVTHSYALSGYSGGTAAARDSYSAHLDSVWFSG
jgi:hypothetical protein